jgi:hypothetical protein
MTLTASLTDKLANIEKLATSGPQLSGSERAEYDRLGNRLQRARADLRRATARDDAKKRASAERAIGNAEAGLREFLAPKVDHLWAPSRIVATFEARWHGRTGDGIHRHECEMVLDRKDLSGPQYRTVRVLKDEGAPPTNARSAPDSMGVAWFAITDQIQRGQIAVIGEEEPS